MAGPGTEYDARGRDDGGTGADDAHPVGDDVGRRKMLAVFDLAAGQPDLVSDFRRRLSATLY